MGAVLAVVTLLPIVSLVAGCSGAGVSAVDLSGAEIQTLGTDQMTILVLVRGWLKVMYPEPTSGTPQVEFEWLDDGYRMYGVDSLGHPFDYFGAWDGSGHGTWQTADGQPVSGYWDAPTGDTVHVQHMHYEYSDMTLEFTNTVDFGNMVGNFAPGTWEGTQTMQDGRVLAFRWHSNAADAETLSLDLPAAGLRLEITVPVAFVKDYGFRPLPASQVLGTAQAPGGAMTFRLSGTNGVWEKLRVTRGQTTGAFTLSGDMAGAGRFEEDGHVTAVMNWPDSLVARLDLTSLATVEVTPVAAARDLAIDRWITSLAGLSPMSVQ